MISVTNSISDGCHGLGVDSPARRPEAMSPGSCDPSVIPFPSQRAVTRFRQGVGERELRAASWYM